MRYWRVGGAAGCVAALATVTSALPNTGPAAAEANALCGLACRRTFRTVRFADAPAGAYFAMQECTSRMHQQSVYLCWDVHCTEDVWLEEARSMNRTCRETYHSALAPHDIVDGITDEDIAHLTRFNATSLDPADAVNELLLPSQAFYDLWIRTLDAYNYAWYHHHYYGWAMGIFWALVVAVGVGNRALAHVGTWSSRPMISSQTQSSSWLKRNVFTPATFGQRCIQDFGGWGTLPPRVQSLTLLLFLLLNVVCSVHGYKIFEGYIYYPAVGMQVLRHVSDRTGVISFANFPLIWLFGMRNNLIIWLTGWDFKTYNNFHRWVARIATLQAIIHSIGYTALILRKGGLDYFWRMCNMTYWWTGELATIFMSFLVLFSVFWFRRQQYEVFLVVHIVLSILILAAMLGHVSIFRGDYDSLVWVPVTIWIFDRVIRGARIVAFNPWFWDVKAQITYHENAHMVRMVVPVSSSLCTIEPGTFYYIMVLNKWNFWESHPFTVASVSGRYDREPLREDSPLLGPGLSSSDEMGSESEKVGREMTFLIRPYDSFTSRLKEYAEAKRPEPATVHVAVDGPYGKALPLERFNKVVFVVGGSGIAVPLSYLNKLTTSSPRPRLIQIHWAVRQPALAVDILNRELNGTFDSEQLSITVYITSVDSRAAVGGEAIHRRAEWRSRRMNVDEVIEEALHAGEDGSLAVVSSGPGRMADDSRKAVVAKMGHSNSKARIEYFEESFQW